MNTITQKRPSAYDLVCAERRKIVLWSTFHLLALTAFALGLGFALAYMRMPDRVIVVGRDRSVYLGNSAKVESSRVLTDVALRAGFSLLQRRYDYVPEKMLEMVFNKRGLGQAKNYFSDTRELFEERKLFQDIERFTVETQVKGGEYFALVKGVLVRHGIYFGYPYTQKRDFALMMRMVKADTDFELPFKVAGMRLYEEEYNE